MFSHRTIASLFACLILVVPLGADQPERTVERIRQLEFERPVTRKTIARSDLRAFLQAQIDADLPYGVEEYAEILRALHLIDETKDPIDRLFALYEVQALAFYDPRTHVYYAIDAPEGEPSGVPEEAIEIHELVHALQDQRFNIGPELEAVRLNWDAAMAYQALLEGEATLVMMAGLYDSMGLDFDAIVRDDSFLPLLIAAAAQNPDIPEGTPPYFVESLSFPYIDGLRFVVHHYKKGGWKALDALHADPPRSTLEILNPEIYQAGKQRVIQKGKAGSGEAGPLLETTLGAFHWKFLLGEDAASGWESDEVEVRKRSGGGLTVLGESGWATEADAGEFAAALRERWKENGADGTIVTEGRQVRFGSGADRAAVERFVRPVQGAPAKKRDRAPSVQGTTCHPERSEGSPKTLRYSLW